ncbi:hypothetical protein [Noviherbaspirillum galbum]|uniref:Lipoprotein n=1 Tax=Noviherbaspirillum galbum TaxID=2709383 RepID=A0A6B3SLK7_9BURK|nr:hypothetical protein [Noviherbaspirillum galbum]NEX61368.1 hypothetical protein [Noviherbaspirillum galbum]
MKSGFKLAVPLAALAAMLAVVACGDGPLRRGSQQLMQNESGGMPRDGRAASGAGDMPDASDVQDPSSAGQRHFEAYRYFQRRGAAQEPR